MMPIVLKMKKVCFGCGNSVKVPKYYEGDEETAWCDECFVTQEQLDALKLTMPCWAGLPGGPPVKKKIHFKTSTSTSAAGADAPSTGSPTAAVAAAPQKKKPVLLKKAVGSSVPAPEAVPVPVADPVPVAVPVASDPPTPKKKPILKKALAPQTTEVQKMDGPQPSAGVAKAKKRPVLLKKPPVAPPASAQSS